jgi:hypothetical protein
MHFLQTETLNNNTENKNTLVILRENKLLDKRKFCYQKFWGKKSESRMNADRKKGTNGKWRFVSEPDVSATGSVYSCFMFVRPTVGAPEVGVTGSVYRYFLFVRPTVGAPEVGVTGSVYRCFPFVRPTVGAPEVGREVTAVQLLPRATDGSSRSLIMLEYLVLTPWQRVSLSSCWSFSWTGSGIRGFITAFTKALNIS